MSRTARLTDCLTACSACARPTLLPLCCQSALWATRPAQPTGQVPCVRAHAHVLYYEQTSHTVRPTLLTVRQLPYVLQVSACPRGGVKGHVCAVLREMKENKRDPILIGAQNTAS